MNDDSEPLDEIDATLDDIDVAIIDRLRRNARESAASIAGAEGIRLTASAVRRRIARLEATEVISGYHVALNHDKMPSSIEAYVELSFAGDEDVHRTLQVAMGLHEVREAVTLAGETDALLRVRARDLKSLRDVVIALRKSGPVTGSVTRIVLGRWWHGSDGE